MKLSDKIINLRKQRGWSQEELAMRLDVSRQSVSKWESNTSIPDMNKIIALSTLFNVTTDYLLKDDFTGEHANLDEEELELIKPKTVTNDVVESYIDTSKREAKSIAFGVLLCILGAISIIFFAGSAEYSLLFATEEIQIAVGLIGLILLVAIAVFLFIMSSSKLNEFEYLKNNVLSLEKRMKEEVKEQYKEYKPVHTRKITISVVAIILSVMPLIIGGLIGFTDYELILSLCLLLAVTMISVYFLVESSIHIEAYQVLLNKGEKSKEEKKLNDDIESFQTIYWVIIVAIYLGWSFLTNDWHLTWIVWPVAGVLSSVIPEIIKIKNNRK